MLYQDELVTAFRDAHPAASTHILIVPNQHFVSLNELEPRHKNLCGHMVVIAQKLARQGNLVPGKISLTINTGLDAGQTVFHLHMHLKSGDDLSESRVERSFSHS